MTSELCCDVVFVSLYATLNLACSRLLMPTHAHPCLRTLAIGAVAIDSVTGSAEVRVGMGTARDLEGALAEGLMGGGVSLLEWKEAGLRARLMRRIDRLVLGWYTHVQTLQFKTRHSSEIVQ